MSADIRRAATSTGQVTTRQRVVRRKGRIVKPLRSVAIFGAVGALVAAVALPAYAATRPPEAQATTVQQLAVAEAQELVIASEVTEAPLTRGQFAATTPEEIAQKKAEAAAAARAAAQAASRGSRANVSNLDLTMVAPGSGAVRWPVSSFRSDPSINDFRTSSRPNHNGFDMLAAPNTPIFAVADGTVRVSSEGSGGYGVMIVIDHVINGQRVSTLYAHLASGSRAVQAGDHVTVGQTIAGMGSTGRSTATHLHLEVTVDGVLVDPRAWLVANAG